MASKTAGKVLSDVEREALRDTVRERKSRGKRSPEQERAEGLAEVQAKIAELPEHDRSMAERIHAIVSDAAPDLVPRTFYGMPAYAKDGKVICFFQAASKFKVRYSTLGFQPDAKLDDGTMWPISFALPELKKSDETRIAELVKRAVG